MTYESSLSIRGSPTLFLASADAPVTKSVLIDMTKVEKITDWGFEKSEFSYRFSVQKDALNASWFANLFEARARIDLLPIFRARVYMKMADCGVWEEGAWRRGSTSKWR
jgi:hypothetical protein